MYDNLITSDHLEQVVQKIQDTKASKSTTLSGYGITDSYTKTETDNRIQDIVGAAPEALDTLEEIAEALQDGESTAAGLVQTLSQKADKSTTVTNIAYGSKKLTKTINGSTTDVVTINAIKSDLALTKSDIGLSNVDNTSDANKPISNATQTALDTKVDKVSGKGLSTNDYTTTEKNKLSNIASNAQVNIIESIKVNNSVLPISSKAVNITVPTKTSELTNNSNFAVDSNYVHTDNNYTTAEKQKLASKVAELDNNGKVLSSQLPSYVDDVVEYTSLANFPTTGESGKIYVDTGANLTYRWTGSTYTEISPSLALGETSSTAYRGDRGKVAYTHATDSNRLTTAKTSGLYKISTTAEGHVASAETATKSDIGLGNVDNTSDLDKPISTATQEALNTKVNATISVLKSDEEFTYRQTGGGSLDIDAKYGKLKSIKGRTLVWNQAVNDALLASWSIKSFTRDGHAFTLTSTATGNAYLGVESAINLGHKYILILDYKVSAAARLISFEGAANTITCDGQWHKFYGQRSSASDTTFRIGYAFTTAAADQVGEMKNIMAFDTTLMFGAGNEPATTAEFDALYPLPYYEYTLSGKLVNNGVQTERDLLWNQLVSNGNFSNGTTGWSSYNSTISAASGELTITKSNSASGLGGLAKTALAGDTSHWYYIACDAKSDSANTEMFFGFHTTSNTIGSNIMVANGTSTYRRISIITRPANATDTLCARIGVGASAGGVAGKIKNVIMCDLTAMFGAGNEPSSITEFEDMFPDPYYPYDTGTEQHFSFQQFKTAIETVGWNQFDKDITVESLSVDGSGGSSTFRYVKRFKALAGSYFFNYVNNSNVFVKTVVNGTYGTTMGVNTSGGTTFTMSAPGEIWVYSSQVADLNSVSDQLCISLADPSRNGTYEPYWRSELELGLGDIKVKSHNIWDEEWEVGQYSSSDGTKISSNNNFRSKNPIRVIPGGKYYGRVPSQNEQLRCCTYDSSGNFLGAISGGFFNNTITFGNDVAFIHICTLNGITPSYSNNICINLSDPAFDGRYEPYGDGGVISITGGLKSAGTVYDEISGNKLVKRIGSVDLGTLTWSMIADSNPHLFYTGNIADARKRINNQDVSNIVTTKYPVDLWVNANDKTIKIGGSGYSMIYIYDSAYTNANTFQAAMSGVPLYYELATPIEYELYNPIDLSYKVDKFGTEKLLPESTSAIVSSPFRADIEYRTTNVSIDDVYGGSDIIKSVEDVDSRLTTIEKSINGLVTIGSGSPTTIPKNIGDFYIDVTNKVLYFATGNQLISDWNS